MADLVAALDSQLERLFGAWNFWTTLLLLLLLAVTVYPIFLTKEPDTHPLLLSRQANVSPVRQPNESGIYRSLEIPYGLALRSGLNVKKAGASKWSTGRDGDLRDVWRQVLNGPPDDQGQLHGSKTSISTVRGKDIEQHDLADLTRQINVFGSYIKQKGCACVAIYLPNSVEMLLAVFAGAFYGFHPVLLPYNEPQDVILRLIQMSSADYLVANAGTLPFSEINNTCKDLREVMWVVQKTSRQMDWGEGSNTLPATTWHELVQGKAATASQDLPAPAPAEEDKVPDLITIWLNESATSGEIVAFSQENLAAATAAQASVLPAKHRLSSDDLFLPAASLTLPYVLTQTLAALYAGASLALNSVAGEGVDLSVACAGISPTIVAASASSAKKLHERTKESVDSTGKRLALRSQTQALQAGYMPPSTWASPARARLGDTPGKLRLLYVYERAHAGTPALTPSQLSELRAFTGARVIYGLTAAKVAGSVAQTSFYDYRTGGLSERSHCHFGPPLSSVEIKLVDTDTHKTVDGQDPMGEIVVIGPAVANERANLGVLGTFRQDGTLAYV